MNRFTGYFNIHFSGRFAVDEEHYSLLIACAELPTQKMYHIPQQIAVDSYLNDYLLYLYAVTSKKIKLQRPKVTEEELW